MGSTASGFRWVLGIRTRVLLLVQLALTHGAIPLSLFQDSNWDLGLYESPYIEGTL